jgi:ATP-dependent Clp protease protease subunit
VFRKETDIRDDKYEYSFNYLTRERRILFLRGVISSYPGGYSGRNDPHSPTVVSDDIIALNLENQEEPIYIIIDSPGGEVSTGMTLYDTMKLSKAPIITIGQNCASMATIILAAGDEKYMFPHGKLMLHLPSTQIQGDTKEVEIKTKEILKVKEDLVQCYIDNGVTAGLETPTATKIRKQILKDIEREFWLNADEAIEYGLADRIIEKDDLFGIK